MELVFVYQEVQKLRDEFRIPLAIANISSHYGHKLGEENFAAPKWGLQCAGKSSREIFLQCAYNEARASCNSKEFALLSFLPGIVQTDMLTDSQKSTII